jgi:geranylgeranyl diphosphate synthase type I
MPVGSIPAVDARLHSFFGAEADRWGRRHPQLRDLVTILGGFVTHGGKRLRGSFCIAGWQAAGGNGNGEAVVDVAAALEVLHAFALIHDDVMDGSAHRRGRPALHRQLQAQYLASGGTGDSRRYGEGLAVLVGDAALAWADRLLAPHRPAVGDIWDELRVELTMGQYLDVVTASAPSAVTASVPAAVGGTAALIGLLKSARYTVTRPLQLGAAVAGRVDDVGDTLASFGDPVGEAFQMRDDLLGVFGDPSVTGKPAGADLREAKNTLLLEVARHRTPATGRRLLARVGTLELTDGDIERLRELFVNCGAVAAVEGAISQRLETAAGALEGSAIARHHRERLLALAGAAAWRAA